MKRFIKPAIALFAIAICGYSFYRQIPSHSQNEENEFLLKNVEVLTQTEETQTLSCTKATRTSNCYRETVMYIDGKRITIQQWAGFKIDAVTQYTVPVGSPLVCSHDAVTSCPKGTHD